MYAKDAFAWVKLDAVAIEGVEHLPYVREECVLDSRHDDDVINVYLHVFPDLFRQSSLHTALIRGSSIL